MAHRSLLRANLAAWALDSAVTPEEFWALDQAQSTSIDGDAGGIWLPSSEIVIGNKGLDVVSSLRSLGPVGFNASMQAQNWPERATLAYSGSLNAEMPFAWGPTMGASGGGRFCALGNDSRSYTSDDGRTWVQRTNLGLGGLSRVGMTYGLIGGAGTFLVLDPIGGTTAISGDGANWALGGATGTGYSVAAHSESLGLWVVAGTGIIKTSPDCITWTSRAVPGGWAGKSPKRLVRANGLFVLLTSDNYDKVLTSPDGITWTEHAVGVTALWASVAYSSYAERWLLVSSTGNVYRSGDAVTWTAVTAVGAAVNDIACNLSLWIVATAAGAKGGIAWSVDNGTTWKFGNVGDHATSLQGYPRVLFADRRFVMLRQSASALEAALSLRSS